jgi:hypothetical protein
MTPKFLELTRMRNGEKVLVNPRRANTFFAVANPSAQPDLAGKCGTEFNFGRGEFIVVRETVEEIKALLK